MQAPKVTPNKTSDSRYRCECNKTVINSIGIATALAAGAYYYMPELKTALTSLSQYVIVSDPSTLVAPLSIAGTLFCASAISAVAANALHSCMRGMVKGRNNCLFISLRLIIAITCLVLEKVAALLGIITVGMGMLYVYSRLTA